MAHIISNFKDARLPIIGVLFTLQSTWFFKTQGFQFFNTKFSDSKFCQKWSFGCTETASGKKKRKLRRLFKFLCCFKSTHLFSPKSQRKQTFTMCSNIKACILLKDNFTNCEHSKTWNISSPLETAGEIIWNKKTSGIYYHKPLAHLTFTLISSQDICQVNMALNKLSSWMW